MALEDLPRFPRKYKPRGDVLIQKIRRNEISMKDFISTFLSVMNKLRIDSSGVYVAGDFGSVGVDYKIYDVINQSMDKMVPFALQWITELIKKRMSAVYKENEEPQHVYLRLGDRFIRFTIKAFLIIPVFVMEEEVKNTQYPVVEIIPKKKASNGDNPLFDLFAWYIGNGELPDWTEYIDIKIHRPEQIVEFVDLVINSWSDVGEVLDLVLPMTALIEKETLDRLAESYPALWDEVFTRCGV